jgi:2'-5' RNA ligase
MARLFFAVGVSREVVSALETLGSKLRRCGAAEWLRFTEPNQAHYTLRFLGEVPSSREVAAVGAGRAAAARSGPFELSLGALGVFPDERRPQTLWIGAGAGASELVAVAASLEMELGRAGFPPEPRPFVPHLTVARVKRRLPPPAMRALMNEPMGTTGSLHVSSFMLMESKPSANGVRYVSLETFPLEIPCTPSKSPSTAAPKS